MSYLFIYSSQHAALGVCVCVGGGGGGGGECRCLPPKQDSAYSVNGVATARCLKTLEMK